jgi:hypothetical protein
VLRQAFLQRHASPAPCVKNLSLFQAKRDHFPRRRIP